jgi:hypothetical protein
MKKEFVSYEQAVALKELGFDEMCFCFYSSTAFISTKCKNSEPWMGNEVVAAPLKQQVFRWFREKYNLHHVVIWDSDTNNFDAGLFGELVIPFLEEDTIFTTYEEAENTCIDKLIELAKQQDNV